MKDLKHAIRKHFHPQLKNLWQQIPLNSCKANLIDRFDGKLGEMQLSKTLGNFRFAPLVSSLQGWDLVAKLDILFLRPSQPGDLIKNGGDLDNRIKILVDSLKIPSRDDLPPNADPDDTETPFYVLLEDDALVVGLGIETETLLQSETSTARAYVELIIRVEVVPRTASLENLII